MTNSNNRLLAALAVVQLLTLIVLAIMFLNLPGQHPTTVSHDKPAGNPSGQYASASAVAGEPVSVELKAALREIIRDELASLPSTAVAGAGEEPASQPDAMLTEDERQEQETAAMISTTVVQQATSAGVWTKADTETLLPHIGKLSEQQRLALMNQLYDAVNRQEMEIEDFPPL